MCNANDKIRDRYFVEIGYNGFIWHIDASYVWKVKKKTTKKKNQTNYDTNRFSVVCVLIMT